MFDFFDFIRDWLLNGIYTMLIDFGKWIVTQMVLGAINQIIWTLGFVWSVAETVIDTLNVSDYIAQGFAMLPPSMHGAAAAMKLPQVVNVLMLGAVAKFTLRFIPFI